MRNLDAVPPAEGAATPPTAGRTPLNELVALKYGEAGALVSVSADTIRRAVKAGELPAVMVGQSPRIRRTDLDAWIDSNPYEPAA
ncbi:excisionase family DNA-binding protein [Rhodococcus sp. NPDC003994]